MKWPGAPRNRSQGAIWNDIVKSGIDWCERLLAFVDLPNANVGFELGYAFGVGKPAALARVRPVQPGWLSKPPLNGFMCGQAESPDVIREVLRQNEWPRPPVEPAKGNDLLLLCPQGSPELEAVDKAWNWRQTEKHGWDLKAVGTLFEGVGRVVWIIVAHNEGPEGRDGAENSALAILAGYAFARGLPLDVFHHTQARSVADVTARRKPYESLEDLEKQLGTVALEHQQAVAANAVPGKAETEELTAETARPHDLGRPPNDDWAALYLSRFIGRERELLDTGAAMQAVARGDANAVRMIWVHGFGGMGKSWFLRCAAETTRRALPELGVLLVEWDSSVWREPLEGEPTVAADLFRPLAYRLAQLRGIAAADPYWLAAKRVERAAEAHRALQQDFDSGLKRAAQGERIESVLLDLLKAEGMLDEEGHVRTPKLEKWRADAPRRTRAFEAWARQAGSRPLADAEAAIFPDRELMHGLAESLRAASAAAPLLLVLDTCEVLNAELDRALRGLVVRLVRDRAPVLVLVGSRLAPDLAQPPGSREGWRPELPRAALSEVPFGENVRFTVEEIETALSKLQRPTPDVADLAERLHSATRGVPLALRALLDLHEEEPDSTILVELGGDDALLEESEAVRTVVAKVAARMLHHLANRPEREEDLADIVALALLPQGDVSVLSELWRPADLWRPSDVRRRLRALAERYSLLGGGDLHPTVREYLRRDWRTGDRPAIFEKVLERLRSAVAALPPPSEGLGISASLYLRLLWVTLSSWQSDQVALAQLAPAIAVALAHEEQTAPLLALLHELAASLPAGDPLRALLPRGEEWDAWFFNWSGRPKVLRWLRTAADSAATWADQERACLDLLEGLAAGDPTSVEEGRRIAGILLRASARFKLNSVPQAQEVSAALESAGYRLQQELKHFSQVDLASLAEQAYMQALALAPRNFALHNNLGALYMDHLKRPEDAEREYRSAIELDPKDASPHFNLGILYMDHLKRPADAEREYLKAIEVDPKNAAGHQALVWLYLSGLPDPGRAQTQMDRCRELDPEGAGTRLTQCALDLWLDGWPRARQSLPDILREADRTIPSSYEEELVTFVRKVRQAGGITELANELAAVRSREWWAPWAEAVASLASGKPPQHWATNEAEHLYRALIA